MTSAKAHLHVIVVVVVRPCKVRCSWTSSHSGDVHAIINTGEVQVAKWPFGLAQSRWHTVTDRRQIRYSALHLGCSQHHNTICYLEVVYDYAYSHSKPLEGMAGTSGVGTNLKVGGGAENYLSSPSTFLALKAQLVVLVSAFVVVNTYSLASFLFAVLLLTVPPVPSHL